MVVMIINIPIIILLINNTSHLIQQLLLHYTIMFIHFNQEKIHNPLKNFLLIIYTMAFQRIIHTIKFEITFKKMVKPWKIIIKNYLLLNDQFQHC